MWVSSHAAMSPNVGQKDVCSVVVLFFVWKNGILCAASRTSSGGGYCVRIPPSILVWCSRRAVSQLAGAEYLPRWGGRIARRDFERTLNTPGMPGRRGRLSTCPPRPDDDDDCHHVQHHLLNARRIYLQPVFYSPHIPSYLYCCACPLPVLSTPSSHPQRPVRQSESPGT